MVKVRAGNVNDFYEGSKKLMTLNMRQVLIVRTDGQFFAVEGRCSHMGIPLDRGTVFEGKIRCPAHGAIFDLATGKVVQNPQARDIKVYPVTIEGDELFVDI